MTLENSVQTSVSFGCQPQVRGRELEVRESSDSASERRLWDEFVRGADGAYHEQSVVYADDRTRLGVDHRRLVCREDGRVVGGVQVMIQKIPLLWRHGVVWHGGPVVINGRIDVAEALLSALDVLARRVRLAAITILPLPGRESLLGVIDRWGYDASSAWSGKEEMFRVSLDGDDADILARMSKKGRYHIRLAQRRGVEVERCDEDAL